MANSNLGLGPSGLPWECWQQSTSCAAALRLLPGGQVRRKSRRNIAKQLEDKRNIWEEQDLRI